MTRARSLPWLALTGHVLLLAAGCLGFPAPALLRPPVIPSSGGFHAEASVGAGEFPTKFVGVLSLPEVRVGLRHGLGPRLDAGLSLSLESGLDLDVSCAVDDGTCAGYLLVSLH